MLVIDLENVTVVRSGRPVLADVNLSVGRGEIVALVGENGAGKSTLLRIVAAELRPTRGAVQVAGYDAALCPADVRRRIGYMPHALGLSPGLSPEEHLYLFGRLFGLDRQRLRSRVQELLSLVELEERKAELVAKLSAGMARRLSFACALVHEPDVVLLDEPTDNMDEASRRRVFEILARLRNDHAAVLVATHDRFEAHSVADRTVTLRAGSIERELVSSTQVREAAI